MSVRARLQRPLSLGAVIAAATIATLLSATANNAAPVGQSFVDKFEQFDRARWYISHGWSNGAHQNCTWFSRDVKLRENKVELSLNKEPFLDRQYTCAEIQTTSRYGYGTYEVRMRSEAASGLVSAFFNYAPKNQESKGQDEIDFEFLGKDSHSVQVNYYTDGNGNHSRNIPLDFDASKSTNDFAFEWLPNSIRWFINGKLIYEVKAAEGEKLPVRPGKIYLSIWNGTGPNMETWLGHFDFPGKSLTAIIERVAFTEAGKPCQFESSIVCKLDQEKGQ
jgi:endo-1,3-1,4-beta-glycanase ExoK